MAGEPWSGGRARTRLWALDTDSGELFSVGPPYRHMDTWAPLGQPSFSLGQRQAGFSSNESPLGRDGPASKEPRAWGPSALMGAGQELSGTGPS